MWKCFMKHLWWITRRDKSAFWVQNPWLMWQPWRHFNLGSDSLHCLASPLQRHPEATSAAVFRAWQTHRVIIQREMMAIITGLLNKKTVVGAVLHGSPARQASKWNHQLNKSTHVLIPNWKPPPPAMWGPRGQRPCGRERGEAPWTPCRTPATCSRWWLQGFSFQWLFRHGDLWFQSLAQGPDVDGAPGSCFDHISCFDYVLTHPNLRCWRGAAYGRQCDLRSVWPALNNECRRNYCMK